MRRAVGLLLILLVLNMGLASVNPVKAISNDPYEAFWEILDREAELVVKVENGNLTLAQELIQNSRLGAENAANISALIWQALEELKASGVKTYYTAEELREMAQNVSQNGLPDETVQALKAQGWTDEQIQALEDYIIQNADSITEDFNMTAFLEDFSKSFLNISSKYSEYVVLPLRKKLETQYGGLISAEGMVVGSEVEGNGMIVPLSGLEEYQNELSALRQVLSSTSSSEVKVNALDNFQLRVLSLIQREPTVIKREKHVVPLKSDSPPCIPKDRIILTIRKAISDKKLRTPNTELLLNYTENNLSNESPDIGDVSFITVDKGVTVINGEYFVYLRTAMLSIRFSNEDCSIHVNENVILKLYQWDAFRILIEIENMKYLILAKSLGNSDPWISERINETLEWLSDDALKVNGVKTLTWSKSLKIPVYSPPVPPKDGVNLEGSSGSDSNYQGSDGSVTSNNLFNVVLTAYPTELEGGGEVYLQVKAWNYDGSLIPVKGFIEVDGDVIRNIEAKIPANANGDSILTFPHNIVGIGNHTIKVFLDNRDGEPNGAGEEHWSGVKVEVKPMSGTGLKQVGFKCDNPKFNWDGIEYKATLVCKAFVYNPMQENVFLNSVSVSEWHTDNSDFTRSLGSSWAVGYPSVIQSSETATIIFKNTAHTGLITLEKDLFGDYISILLKYVVSPQNGNDITFTGTDTINIKQDNKDVIVDVGTNVMLIGMDVKAGITIVKLARSGETVSALKNSWPYMVSFFRWAWPKLDN
ncbi:hypothetical protein [Thermococcus sp. M36]|uniref:hypothetical protein n=1 Tax=Thermococcus sp. M36 TaxID=1638261 RepID=UPI001F0DC7E5|nr:hypothetical protein [Thermococcus sp. M36]